MTLYGDPTWALIMWQWDSRDYPKILSKIDIVGKEMIPKNIDGSTNFVLTLQPASLDLYATVTGPNVFHFFKIN